MNILSPVTPNEASIVWNSIARPSARRVARSLSQAGRRVHHSTVARWRAEGWRPVESGLHPLDAARQALDVAAPVLTGDPAGGAQVLLQDDELREELESLAEPELLSRTVRAMCITNILVCGELQRDVENLVRTRLKELAVLMKAQAAALAATSEGFKQVERMKNAAGG